VASEPEPAAAAPALSSPAVAEAEPVAAPTRVAPVEPVSQPRPAATAFVLPLGELQSLAQGAGLEWVNSDVDKVAAVQAAIAAEPKPVRVPRERPPLVVLDEGPLILVETRRDLSEPAALRTAGLSPATPRGGPARARRQAALSQGRAFSCRPAGIAQPGTRLLGTMRA
jgi:hypothetical protein